MIEIIIIAIGLSMDSFAVSLASGICHKKNCRILALLIAIFFGVFQGAFAGMGWLLSSTVKHLIEQIDHWVAFVLLLLIGGKLILGAIRSDPAQKSFNIESYLVLLGLSVATSIDALIAGMGFGFLNMHIVPVMIVIGLVTVFFSFSGFLIGSRNGYKLLGKRAEIIGGIMIIAIGIRILIEHLAG